MSDLAEEKKRAEKCSRESFEGFREVVRRYIDGNITRDDLEGAWLALEHDYDVDMGLRHE